VAFALPDLGGAATEELEAELERQAAQLLARVIEGRDRVARLRDLVGAAEQQLEGDEAMLRHVQTLLGRSDQLSLETLDSHLRGARVREVALQILERRDEAHDGVYYRDWYQWVTDAGYTIAGRDPLATFLAQVSRSPTVERVGGRRSGRYRVKTA
jgi:hypothetical protein